MFASPVATKKPVFRLILVKPSKYDDEGYVIRYWRGVLPSNTLSAIYSLTRHAVDAGCLGGDVKVEVTLLDEISYRVEPEKLIRKARRGGARVAVMLVGVQSNQFPRAADLARKFRAMDVPVLIGGFHVSGSLALFQEPPAELQSLMDEGITLVKGEVEDIFGEILRDVYEGRPKLLYDISEKPDLSHAPIPEVADNYLKKFAYPNMGTIDAGRGCPFACSFCTIINVQGRKMRNRSAESIGAHIRANYSKGINYYFFTDDNFARNKNWEAILDDLIQMREVEGLDVTFMMQVDTLAYRIKNFCEKSQRAGCTQVFIGLEAIRDANLDAVGKTQNVKVDYHEMAQAWRDHGIAIHTGYIIGFPEDTPQTVAEDIRFLKDELKIDQASFFMLTPLPGSMDHYNMVVEGKEMDPDFNKFDSFHAVTPHPKMTGEEWFNTYINAWNSFYTFDHMRDSLLRANPTTYWGLFKNFIWYKTAVLEKTHPMIAGFFRLKDRTDRRPGYAVEGVFTHLRKRTIESARTISQWAKMYYEMQELWLQTRPGRGQWRASLMEWRDRATTSAQKMQERAAERISCVRESAQESYANLKNNMRTQYNNGKAGLAALGKQINPSQTVSKWKFWSARDIHSRQWLNHYWAETFKKLRQGRIYAINPLKLTLNLLRDIKLSAVFTICMLAARTK